MTVPSYQIWTESDIIEAINSLKAAARYIGESWTYRDVTNASRAQTITDYNSIVTIISTLENMLESWEK